MKNKKTFLIALGIAAGLADINAQSFYGQMHRSYDSMACTLSKYKAKAQSTVAGSFTENNNLRKVPVMILRKFISAALICAALFSGSGVLAQKETTQWYFGSGTARDFLMSPPAQLTCNPILPTGNSAATISMADSAGNLLFYSNGYQVYNATQTLMANGGGLISGPATPQGLAVKIPGSNTEYYLFTAGINSLQGLYCSKLDMSLAAGLGSVTVKNMLLSDSSNLQMAATMHCNGTDIWLLSHKMYTSQYTAYLITAAGINTTPVLSVAGPTMAHNAPGQLKISPNGSKVALALHYFGYGIFDFDNSTGIVSNYQGFGPFPGSQYCQGVEFSPDGTKLYGVQTGTPYFALQWDLCAGSPSAIAASQTTLAINTLNHNRNHLQIAPNGKIYYTLTQPGKGCFGVIHQPNRAGLACQFQDTGDCGTKIPYGGLPGFVSNLFRQKIAFTYTAQCQSASFHAFGSEFGQCYQVAASGYSNLTASWDFGDPGSGTANTSNQVNPVHYFSGVGTYSVRAILNYKCRTDTIIQSVTISNANPSFTITGPAAICPAETHTLHASGSPSLSYAWSSGQTVQALPINPSVTTVYTVTATDTITGCSTTLTHIVTMKYCVGLPEIDALSSAALYPNPGRGLFNLESKIPVTWLVRDVLGRTIIQSAEPANRTLIDLTNFGAGMYFVELQSESARRTILLQKVSD